MKPEEKLKVIKFIAVGGLRLFDGNSFNALSNNVD